MSIKKGLGKGLGALLSIYDEENDLKQSTQDSKNEKKDDVDIISMSDIITNPNQPRKNFDNSTLTELAESIKTYGVIQPIVVTKKTNGKYMIIAGERRFRASKIAGFDSIPCIVKNYTEKQVKEIALIENLQREDLNPVESARAIKTLMEEYSFTQEVVADRIGKSRPYVANLLRILQATPEVIALVEQNKLSLGHARTLISIENVKKQNELANYCVKKGISVRELEKLVKKLSKPKNKEEKFSPPGQSRELVNFTDEMQRLFSTKVSISGNEQKGKIIIDYFSKDDLDRIYTILNLAKTNHLTLKNLRDINMHK